MKKNIKKIIYIESNPSFLDQHSIINEDLLELNNEFYYLKKKISSTGIIYNVQDYPNFHRLLPVLDKK